MTRPTQKAEEERFARQLISCLGAGPIERLEPGDSAPDFVVSLAGRTLALEVTQIFRTSERVAVPRQATENYRSALLAAAAEEWERRGGPHVEVLAHFNDYVPVP